MKKLILTALIVFLATISWAEDKDTPEPTVQQCPKTLMTESCLGCHVVGDFRVKETKPDANLVYPNSTTRILNGIGYVYLYAVESDSVKQSFDYLRLHGIDYIVMEIHSPGGSLLDAWRIVGLMRFWKSKGGIIETRCHGFAASAGFLIFCSGTKGLRYVNSQAELMWHELYTFEQFKIETPSDKEEAARVLRHLQDTGNEYLASVSSFTKEEIDSKVKKREFWMRGSQAIEYGFAEGSLNK